ncbi:MAG: flagellar hook-basal body complex protein [Sedimentisphaerales bacterium]|nr:flagellar hook-basal body complex protein [Sedimentisphaerales bacterium]
MGLTSSLFAGLTGMKTNEFRMDVIGNNIANVNTYAYKSSRASFQNQFLHTLSFGSAPSGTIGGTNPMQIGTGSMVGAVGRDFSGGAPETTGMKSDLAIQGQGMFILEKPDGGQVYTRDGSYQFNSENYLLSADGYFLQGYAVDSDFNIIEGALNPMRIPLGEITTSSPTSQAQFSGDLNANGDAASARPELFTQEFYSENTLTTLATGLTPLTSLYDVTTGATPIFYNGNVITLKEAQKGGANLDEANFIVGTDGSTLADLAAWLEDVLGINTSTGLLDIDLDGDLAFADDYPGVSVEADGRIRVVGNIGTKNAFTMETGSVTASQGAGASAPGNTLPIRFPTDLTDTDHLGESIRTSFRAYDSIGNPMDINITMAMEIKDNTGITWRYFAESADDSDFDRCLGTGTIKFDPAGQYLEGTGLTIEITRDSTGAATPQTITLGFEEMDGFAMTSAMSLLTQDGFQSGTLQDYSIGPDGVITGSFTNGLTRTLGQVVLATFRNYEGLVSDASNVYTTGPNSGNAIVKKPQELGAGTIISGALELSNVDLSREFINLIITSTGFSASSRIIQTSDRLLSELIMMTR